MAVKSKFANGQFWVDTADRAVATFFQAGIAALGAGTVGIVDANLTEAASVGALAALIAVGTSIAFRGGVSEKAVAGVEQVEPAVIEPASPEGGHGP